MVKLYVALAFAIFATVYVVGWLVWRLVGRSLAVAWGLITPTAHDYLVVAWRAESEGRLEDALDAYETAFKLDPFGAEVQACWTDFQARHIGLETDDE